jgi:enoyl-CoA hydratase/carnithine racemase
MSDRVLIDVDQGVAHVRLNRPDKLNALDPQMFDAIAEAGASLAQRPGLRAVVLSGEGRSFCAGLDFAAFMAGGEQAQGKLIGERIGAANLAQRVSWTWRELPVPVIAAVRGHCFGGGLQIAMGADIRIASDDAEMSVMEVRWGIIPDMGFSRTLMGAIRPDILAELTWTGRRVKAEEAERIGLVTRRSEDPVAEALALARTIAGKSPDAIRAGKRLMREAGGIDTAAAFVLETDLQVSLLGSPNQMEAVMAGFSKRAPEFRD